MVFGLSLPFCSRLIDPVLDSADCFQRQPRARGSDVDDCRSRWCAPCVIFWGWKCFHIFEKELIYVSCGGEIQEQKRGGRLSSTTGCSLPHCKMPSLFATKKTRLKRACVLGLRVSWCDTVALWEVALQPDKLGDASSPWNQLREATRGVCIVLRVFDAITRPCRSTNDEVSFLNPPTQIHRL